MIGQKRLDRVGQCHGSEVIALRVEIRCPEVARERELVLRARTVYAPSGCYYVNR